MANPDYSFAGMMEFLEYAGDKGLIKLATTRAYRSAASKVSEDLTEQESADVRQIDPDVVFQRYVNRNRVQVKPDTLAEYKRRMSRMVREFVRWREDPTAYRPRGVSAGNNNNKNASRKEKSKPEREDAPVEPTAKTSSHEPAPKLALNLPYPLRPDFLATIQVPRDMTSDEASRLAAFVKTLATDFNPKE